MTYRTVQSVEYWDDPWVDEQVGEIKLLYLFLFTGPKTNTAGLLKLSYKKIGEYICQDRNIAKSLMDYMMENKKVFKSGDWFWVKNFIRDQIKSKSPNVVKGVASDLKVCPEMILVKMALERYPYLVKPFGDAPGIISGSSNDDPEIIKEKGIEEKGIESRPPPRLHAGAGGGASSPVENPKIRTDDIPPLTGGNAKMQQKADEWNIQRQIEKGE